MAASPHPSGSGSQAEDEYDPLELTALDADSLFNALGAVEKAIPGLLASVKPVLAHLTTGTEGSAKAAEEGVEEYMNTLDKIQYVLRQTVYYLRETHASTSALRPPPANALPTPFAAVLAPAAAAASRAIPSHISSGVSKSGADGQGADQSSSLRSVETPAAVGGVEPDLGLYGSRVEARVMKEMVEVLGRIQTRSGREGVGLGGQEHAMEDDV